MKISLTELSNRLNYIVAEDSKERSSICGERLSDNPPEFEFYVPSVTSSSSQIGPFKTRINAKLIEQEEHTKVIARVKTNLIFPVFAFLSLGGMTAYLIRHGLKDVQALLFYAGAFIAMYFIDRISKNIALGTFERYLRKK